MSDVSELTERVAKAIEQNLFEQPAPYLDLSRYDLNEVANAALDAAGVTTLQSTVSRLREALEPIREEIKMILMGADYTGLSPKTHAWVPMDLLERTYEALKDIQSMKDGK